MSPVTTGMCASFSPVGRSLHGPSGDTEGSSLKGMKLDQMLDLNQARSVLEQLNPPVGWKKLWGTSTKVAREQSR